MCHIITPANYFFGSTSVPDLDLNLVITVTRGMDVGEQTDGSMGNLGTLLADTHIQLFVYHENHLVLGLGEQVSRER